MGEPKMTLIFLDTSNQREHHLKTINYVAPNVRSGLAPSSSSGLKAAATRVLSRRRRRRSTRKGIKGLWGITDTLTQHVQNEMDVKSQFERSEHWRSRQYDGLTAYL